MALTEILVHLDPSPGCPQRLAVAVALAGRQRARLTGLMVVRHRFPSEEVVAEVWDRFERQAASAGVEGLWRCIDGSEAEASTGDIFTAQGHYSDLLVVGQASAETASAGVPFDFPEGVVLGSGRPVLIVPSVGTFPTVGERVLVAWKESGASARAVNDALPILAQARRVEILARRPPEEAEGDGGGLCEGVLAHLARHGVAAGACPMMLAHSTVGDALLNRACDEGFDLLVMGAHARGPEGRAALGSVARHLLRQMTVPVLMSH